MTSAGEIKVHVTIDEEQVKEAARLAARLFRSEYAAAVIAEDVDEDRVQVDDEPPHIGAQVTNANGLIAERFEEGWKYRHLSTSGGWCWSRHFDWDIIANYPPLYLTTDEERRAADLPVGNDPCVCLSEEPCRVHDDIEDVTEEPPEQRHSDDANCEWAQYRKDYGVDPTDATHKAFHAGFKTAQKCAKDGGALYTQDEVDRQIRAAWYAVVRRLALTSAEVTAESTLLASVLHRLDDLKEAEKQLTAARDRAEQAEEAAERRKVRYEALRADMFSWIDRTVQGQMAAFLLDRDDERGRQ